MFLENPTILVADIGTRKISEQNLEYLQANESTEKALVYWQLVVDKKQIRKKKFFLNFVIFCLFLKIEQKMYECQ